MKFALLFAFYILASKFSLWIQGMTGMGTQIWPASGIALACVLNWGYRVSPAIFLATLTIHATQGDSVLAFLGPAAGNTVEALVGAYLCSRPPRLNPSLDNQRDIGRLIFGAAFASTLVGALIAVPFLWVTKFHKIDLFYFIQYWAGDSMGVLMVAPLIFAFSAPLNPSKSDRINLTTLALTTFLIALVGVAVLFEKFPASASLYFFFPLMLWSAIRFGQRGVSLTTLVLAATAIAETVKGIGPFGTPIRSTLNEFSLLLFVATLQMTGLIVAGVFSQREYLLVKEKKAKDEAQSAVRVRDEFLDLAAHELHTPMTSLSLAIKMLRDHFGEFTREKIARLLDISWSQTVRLTQLSNDLLDIKKLEQGQRELRIDRFDLGDLAREIVSRLELNIQQARCAISIQTPGPVEGEWDRSQIDEVITNLLSNAIKFGRDHPIEITISKSAEETAQETAQETATMAVRDHGIGISPTQQSLLFRRFERGVSGRQFAGLGLGLYISRRIVRAHGGSLQVESRIDEGALFTMRLPCRQVISKAA